MCMNAEDEAQAHVDKCALTLFYTLLPLVILKAALIFFFKYAGEKQLCEWMYNLKQC